MEAAATLSPRAAQARCNELPMSDFARVMPQGGAVTPRGRFNLVMGLLVAGALGFAGWRWRQQAQEAAAVSAQIAARAVQAGAHAEGKTPGGANEARGLPFGAPSMPLPLPPWGQPLGANLALVRVRADAGDARAACRLGVELALCGQSGANHAPHIEAARRLALQQGQSPAQADAAADTARGQLVQRNQDPARYCEGMDRSLRGQAGAYLRKAALAGNRDALLRYAQGAFFGQAGSDQDQYRYLHDPAFGHWYREAVPMLQRALRAGDPMAAQLLADAYADDRTPLDALLPDDPVQAYSYRLLLSWLRGEPAPDAGALDPRQRADAEQQAQRLYRESFGSRPVPGGVPRALALQPDDPTTAPCQ